MKTRFAAALALSVTLATTPGRVSATPIGAPVIQAYAVPGTSIQRVRASTEVDAPIERVRSVLFDYGRYPEFMPMYVKPTGVIWTTPAGLRLVHMQIGGIVSLWMRVEIGPPKTIGSVEIYEGRLVQGNIKAFRPRWELQENGGKTRVTVESFLDPDLPLVPSGLVNSGAKDGMRDAIVALKNRVERQRASR